MNQKIKVAISVGDVAGVGMEIIAKTFADSRLFEVCLPIVYGSFELLKNERSNLQLHDLKLNKISKVQDASPSKLNVMEIFDAKPSFTPGISSKETGQAAYLSLSRATEDLAATRVDVLLTTPITKDTMQWGEQKFKGHTEYLAHYSHEPNPLMLMIHEGLKVGVVTGHVSLKEVPKNLSVSLIMDKIERMNSSLIQDFNVVRPRIAVLGLNPHNGDHGMMGNEEIEMIEPSINKSKEKGILAFGPYAADGFFGSGNYLNFDGILAMYHDQGLVPFKALSKNEGVNFTAGLPIVRTSPDHGPALDLAGKNAASETSFRNSIYVAIDVFRNRSNYKNLTAQ
ncbi:MAG TPA: 4-hydroxythreonine-4-phosphate dehydrogenase PdxA [Flavobacteriales bacterium]|jgi:4-hydroxythreonine-4-phosphate dehydrogenase|nr:4-hydroxythreonine-4-phosphate dehydrogenase PdxA [Flavobacteriales bacterium]